AVPVGGLVPYAGTAAPEGTSFLPADGRALSATDYPALYAAIGTTYGDGSTDVLSETDFNLPDTRNVFVKGATDNGAERTFADPLNAERVRLDNNARGSVLDPGVMSNHELAAALPSVSFMFLIRVK
ncbi:MAG: tail fiber protein, partial [Ignavibacteriae bacterium]